MDSIWLILLIIAILVYFLISARIVDKKIQKLEKYKDETKGLWATDKSPEELLDGYLSSDTKSIVKYLESVMFKIE